MCTGIKIQAKTGEVFWGRTLDLNMPLFPDESGHYIPAAIATFPANQTIESQYEPWTSKYNFMGIGIEGSHILLDGINEHGLAGDLQVLKECGWAELEDIKKQQKTPVLAEEFVCYILSNYKTVSEIRSDVDQFMLLNQPFKLGEASFHFPIHFSFVDESGDGIVIESLEDGSLVTFDYLNIMTNSPRYDYHQVNIRNYIGMSDVNITEPKTLSNGITIEPIEGGTGFGLVGIPGDYTSPSRFVRGFCFSSSLNPFPKEKGFNELYSIFRTVIVPEGLERSDSNPKISDHTRYWSGYDLAQRKLVVQTGKGLAFTTKSLDLNKTSVTFDTINIDIDQ